MKDKVVLIQGAMDIEIECLLSKLKNRKDITIAGYEFYEGSINNIEVVISKTLVGTINSTMATTIGVINFHPNIVINQGIAGAHRTDLHIGDIIVGEKCCNINSYKMPSKDRGKGYATEQIRLALQKCKEQGIENVFMDTYKTNIGSVKSIIKNGGILEDEITINNEIVQIYKIDLKNKKR